MFSIGRKLKHAKELAKLVVSKGASFESFMENTKGETNIFKLVISVFIVAILVSALIPTAITSIIGANTSTWDAGTAASYGAISVLVVIAIIAILAGIAYRAFND